MHTAEASGLILPRCCAHLISWDDGPFTARTHAVAVPAGRSAKAQSSESATAAGPSVLQSPAIRAVGT